MAPTPATSPEKIKFAESLPKKVEAAENGEGTPIEIVNGKLDQMALQETPTDPSQGEGCAVLIFYSCTRYLYHHSNSRVFGHQPHGIEGRERIEVK